ncbi:MAG: hypothetical protein P1U77_17670, partial [Rubripirellula sp.]|nr:hypothetical protein [Rubripirellula sp.]
ANTLDLFRAVSLTPDPKQLQQIETTAEKQMHAPLSSVQISSVQTLPRHRLPEGNNDERLGFKTQLVEVRLQADRRWADDQQQGDTRRCHQR